MSIVGLGERAQIVEIWVVIERMAKPDPSCSGSYAWRGALAEFGGDPESAISEHRDASVSRH